MSSLLERLNNDYAPGWKPKPGDSIVGEVVGLSERTSDYQTYGIVTVRQDDGVAAPTTPTGWSQIAPRVSRRPQQRTTTRPRSDGRTHEFVTNWQLEG
jgi:hypothetical protein